MVLRFLAGEGITLPNETSGSGIPLRSESPRVAVVGVVVLFFQYMIFIAEN